MSRKEEKRGDDSLAPLGERVPEGRVRALPPGMIWTIEDDRKSADFDVTASIMRICGKGLTCDCNYSA